jgi:undecaprenyl-diphosphatase
VSRQGDGWAWYALILAQLIRRGGAAAALHVALTGAAGLLGYRLIKRHAVRERSFVTHAGIRCVAAPLDRDSFPSGRTLHAVAAGALLGSGLALGSVRLAQSLAG